MGQKWGKSIANVGIAGQVVKKPTRLKRDEKQRVSRLEQVHG
jgi:hypothetical protein